MPWTPEDWEGLLDPPSRATHPDAPNLALAEILSRLPDRERMTLAHFGCFSAGRLSPQTASFDNVLAVAESDSMLAVARRACPDDNVRCVLGDLSDLSGFATSIDVAVAMDVLHLLSGAPLDAFIEQLHGCLVEGGILLLSVPAAKRMGGPIELHLGKNPSRVARQSFHEVEAQYRLRRAGFQGVRIRRFEAADGGTGTLLCMAVRRTIN